MNIYRVIVHDEVPKEVMDLVCVSRFGPNSVREIAEDSVFKKYGNYMMYTVDLNAVVYVLQECGFKKETIFYQDLDSYGPDKVFEVK